MKFDKNVSNDAVNQELLRSAGWKVIILWECDINKRFEETMLQVIQELKCKIDENI